MYKKIIFIFIVIIVLIRGIYGLYKINSEKENLNNKITFYELKTHEYFSVVNNGKYYIDSKEELKKFYSLYSDKISIDEGKLSDNTFFIETIKVPSGSISIKLNDVNLNNNKVNFVIDKNTPEIGTDDMAFWYLVAIIPNDMLKNINISEWEKPSSVLNNKYLDK